MEFITTLLAFLNLYILFKQVFPSIWRNISLVVLFCLMSLYFVSIPLFLDSIALLLGYEETWNSLITTEGSYSYELESLVLFRVCLFVLAFNILFLLAYSFFQKIFNRIRTHRDPQLLEESNHPHKITEYVTFFSILAWFGFLLFIFQAGFSWDMRELDFTSRTSSMPSFIDSLIIIIRNACFALAGVAVYFAIRYKRYAGLFLSLFPPILVSISTSHRPFAIPVLICLFVGMIHQLYSKSPGEYPKDVNLSQTQKRIFFKYPLKYISKFVLVVFLAFVLALQFGIIRKGINSITALDYPYPISRDSSLNMLYYCFSNHGGYYDFGTEFFAIKRLLITGILPTSVTGQSEGPEEYEVTRYLAIKRFAWGAGTLHASIYGWAFTDMKWVGSFFSIFVALIIAIVSWLGRGSQLSAVVMFSITTVFVSVAMRGSVQYAYSNLIYTLVLFFLIKSFLGQRLRI